MVHFGRDVRIEGDGVTYVEFQNNPNPPEPIKVRAVEYFTLSLSAKGRDDARVVRQIWVLAERVDELLHGAP